MRTAFRLITMFFLAAVILFNPPRAVCVAEEGEYQMSPDPRLAEPGESFEKGREYAAKGHREFRRRPGLAQKMFEHAEDYFLKASFLYKELGQKHGIDVTGELAACERAYRKAHVMVGKSRKQRKRSGAGY